MFAHPAKARELDERAQAGGIEGCSSARCPFRCRRRCKYRAGMPVHYSFVSTPNIPVEAESSNIGAASGPCRESVKSRIFRFFHCEFVLLHRDFYFFIAKWHRNTARLGPSDSTEGHSR